MQDDDLDQPNVTESTWILSLFSGDELWQLMVSQTLVLCGKFVQFLRYVVKIFENKINVPFSSCRGFPCP